MARRKYTPLDSEFAKQRGMVDQFIRNFETLNTWTCKYCGKRLEYKELGLHRKNVHDAPRGIVRHTEYYSGSLHGGQSQIVLIDPYTISASRHGPSSATSWGVGFNEPHVFISASDQDIDNYPRSVSIYLSREDARNLAHQLLKAAEDVT